MTDTMPDEIYAADGPSENYVRMWYKTKGMGTRYIRADLAPSDTPEDIKGAVDVCHVIARLNTGKFCKDESGTDWNWGNAIHVLIRAAQSATEKK